MSHEKTEGSHQTNVWKRTALSSTTTIQTERKNGQGPTDIQKMTAKLSRKSMHAHQAQSTSPRPAKIIPRQREIHDASSWLVLN
jgi:hypothetical protein